MGGIQFMSAIKKMINNNYRFFSKRKEKEEDEKKKVQNNKIEQSSIAQKWTLLSGTNNWEGLLDPLDDDLRRYILHYGEMAQATYDNFNHQKASKFAGSWRYSKQSMFEMVGLEKGNPFKYSVTKYVHATSSIPVPDAFIVKSEWNRESNWIGYVAVATDEGAAALGRRDIVVAWRGTVRSLEWVNDFEFAFVEAPKIFGDSAAAADHPKVHLGWYSIYTSEDAKSPVTKISARDQVLAEISRLVNQYKNEQISITIVGHSMGAAVGTLNAVDIVINVLNKGVARNSTYPVTAFLFASPRVGDINFKNAISKLQDNLHILRVRNGFDIVPNYPLIGFADVGEVLPIDTTKSEYLKVPGDFTTWHSLEAYLHGVAGYQGAKAQFKIEKGIRDIALVNKHLDALKDEYSVPSSWWVDKNNGMVQQDDRTWILMDHEDADISP
ncbi:unnamed protein product [Cuscuta epithymum]|uniref:Phospholipase A1 n=1 Tax=Cuscuta epithymum TaxID=186058 RepID=A0AAV0CMZ8_9ASTE|nr:unnamed protein product [Cuscuta epithymum]